MGGKVAKKLADWRCSATRWRRRDAAPVRAGARDPSVVGGLNNNNAGLGKPTLAARNTIDLRPVAIDATGDMFGDLPNIAVRSQALAEPSAVAAGRVQCQAAGLFVAEERGNHELKGMSEPVTLYRIVRTSGVGRRAGQRHVTPLVGSEESQTHATLRASAPGTSVPALRDHEATPGQMRKMHTVQ
jgi:class 3 adenylate cyclase